MAELRRYQLSRAAGAAFPHRTRKVDRSTRFGNPFRVGTHGTRDEVVKLFGDLAERGMVTMTSPAHVEEQRAYIEMLKAHLGKLRGFNLACWCSLPKDGEPDICHGAVLLRLANRPTCEAADETQG